MDNNNRFEYQIERPAVLSEGTPPPSPQNGRKRRRALPVVIALFLVFTLAIGGAGGVLGYYISQNNAAIDIPADTQSSANAQPPADTQSPADEPAPPENLPVVAKTAAADSSILSIQEVFSLGDKSTVAISTQSESTNVFGQQVSQASAGSGFILTSDGYIMTNHHVIEDAANVTVMLHDGTQYPAEIIGSDNVTDIAVLKIKADGLSPAGIGDSDKAVVGDQVVAIGNPLGELANSLSVGYLSAKKRIVSIDEIPRVMIQTDASVSPGNSGGPLFNCYGQVIGVVSAKTVASGVEGIGFAIPINLAADIANELIANGEIKGRPVVGVTVQDVSSLTDRKDYPYGAYVAEVSAGSAAEKAGIKAGDVITSLNDIAIASADELKIAKNLSRVGDTVTVIVWRGGKEVTLSLTFDTEAAEAPVQQQQQLPQYFNPWQR